MEAMKSLQNSDRTWASRCTSVQPFSVEPGRLRDVVHTLQRDPKACLILCGPSCTGKWTLMVAISKAYPALYERIFKNDSSLSGDIQRDKASIRKCSNFSLDRLCRLDDATVLEELTMQHVFQYRVFLLGTDALVSDIKAVMDKRYTYRFFAPESRIEWSKKTHMHVSVKCKVEVKAVLILRKRACPLYTLPLDIAYEIFVHLQRLYWE